MVVVRLSASLPPVRTFLLFAAGGLFVLFSILKLLVITDPDTSLTRTVADAFLTNVYYLTSASNPTYHAKKITGRVTGNSPESGSRPKAGFVYLFAKNEHDSFLHSIDLLYRNFNLEYAYPIYVYYNQPDVDAKQLSKDIHERLRSSGVTSKASLDLISIIKIDFLWPAGVDATKFKQINKVYFGGQAGTTEGYNHMIRFWMTYFWDRPEIQGLEYYMRLDTDSLILSKIDFDIFHEIQAQDVKYVFNHIMYDANYVVQDLWNFVDQYFKANAGAALRAAKNGFLVPSPLLRGFVKQRAFYTNFEVAHVPTFTSKDFRDFANAIDKSLGIYVYRWGDAPLRFIQAMMYLDVEKDIGIACSFDYMHLHHDKTIKKWC